MKKITKIIFFSLVCFVITTSGVSASIIGTNLGTSSTEAGLKELKKEGDLSSAVGTVLNSLLGLLGVIFLIITVYAGALWMLSGQTQENADKAKKMLVEAVLGLVITLMSYQLTNYVFSLIKI